MKPEDKKKYEDEAAKLKLAYDVRLKTWKETEGKEAEEKKPKKSKASKKEAEEEEPSAKPKPKARGKESTNFYYNRS